jgi:aspartate racemase
MPKHIGIVGCSAEGAALCYRTICSEAADRLGEHEHPEVTLHTYSLARYMEGIRSGDWMAVAELMLSSAGKLAQLGADFAVCPDNTLHQAFRHVEPHSPIPWLHIAQVVAGEAADRGHRRLALTGTRYLMTGPVYPEALERRGIEWEVPEEEDREKIDRIIFGELVHGVFLEKSRRFFNEVIARLAERGCDAAVLGCSEIPLLVDPKDCPLPTLDSTRLLARAALRESLAGEQTQEIESRS